MDYAINKITGALVSAARASKHSRYVCPVCQKSVSLRWGRIRPPYFAHLPGYGTSDCDNFIPGHSSPSVKENINNISKLHMELRLFIPMERGRGEWSLILVLPTCNSCRAKITLDVGGRSQTIDMRSMVKSRQIGAELSVKPYRIVSFAGEPDPEFVAKVERECPGLPSVGAAVFTAFGSGISKGFPLAQELRCTETFAFLWKSPVHPDFPDELEIKDLVSKLEWNLALVTIPENPSVETILWLKSFTHLPVVPARASVTAIWPFQIQNTSINQIECARSNIILLSANMVSAVSSGNDGPTMYAQGYSSLLSAIGVEKSPAFFTLNPGESELVGISGSNEEDISLLISFYSQANFSKKYPSIDLAFTKKNEVREIVSLHQRKCIDVAIEARRLGYKLEYLSMPPGVKGIARIKGDVDVENLQLFADKHIAPHDKNMRLLPPDVLSKLDYYLSSLTCSFEIDFAGLGRISIPESTPKKTDAERISYLSPGLRMRILSFLLQMRLLTSKVIVKNDISLVSALENLQPVSHLLPHYRTLVKEIRASGFQFNRLK